MIKFLKSFFGGKPAAVEPEKSQTYEQHKVQASVALQPVVEAKPEVVAETKPAEVKPAKKPAAKKQNFAKKPNAKKPAAKKSGAAKPKAAAPKAAKPKASK
jgi:hypothetical protein